VRDPKRIDEMCEQLKKLWKLQPDIRLGQLVCNTLSQKNLFYVEDDTALEIINKKIEEAEKWRAESGVMM
jgi:hypothetical protein